MPENFGADANALFPRPGCGPDSTYTHVKPC